MTRSLKIDSVQFGAKVGRHMLDFGRDPKDANQRKWLLDYIQDIYQNPMQIREGTFSGQGGVVPSGSHARGAVLFYAKGDDVVVVDMDENFVTILKDGVQNSTSFKLAAPLTKRPGT